jgi:hypothetical protein
VAVKMEGRGSTATQFEAKIRDFVGMAAKQPLQRSGSDAALTQFAKMVRTKTSPTVSDIPPQNECPLHPPLPYHTPPW